jgi:hypothetical protein
MAIDVLVGPLRGLCEQQTAEALSLWAEASKELTSDPSRYPWKRWSARLHEAPSAMGSLADLLVELDHGVSTKRSERAAAEDVVAQGARAYREALARHIGEAATWDDGGSVESVGAIERTVLLELRRHASESGSFWERARGRPWQLRLPQIGALDVQSLFVPGSIARVLYGLPFSIGSAPALARELRSLGKAPDAAVGEAVALLLGAIETACDRHHAVVLSG